MADVVLAPDLERYAPLRSITEADLFRGIARDAEARPCACGGVVVADPADPADGLREHQASRRHAFWRAWVES